MDYYFLTPEAFAEAVAQDRFVEWEEVYKGTCYGTLRSEVERIWAKGHVIVFDVDVMGGLNLKRIFGADACSVFIMPPSIEELRRRWPNLEVVEQGSSYKFCLLAEGTVDYYVRTSPTYEWDTAAGELILSEAGGQTRSLPEGRELRYNEEDLHNPWFVCRAKCCRL